jgi:hypothetical protein
MEPSYAVLFVEDGTRRAVVFSGGDAKLDAERFSEVWCGTVVSVDELFLTLGLIPTETLGA